MKKRILFSAVFVLFIITVCGAFFVAGCQSEDLSNGVTKYNNSTETVSSGDMVSEEAEYTEEIASEEAGEEGSTEYTEESGTNIEYDEDNNPSVAVNYTKDDLKKLKNTDIFLSTAIEHIFLGTINKKGNATGYHSEVIEDSDGEVIEGTRTEPDSFGVYSGKVEVNGISKTGNKGYSTFFPSTMSPQEVVDAISEAYESRELLSGNLYAGLTGDGMEIDMALTNDGKIITAYPVLED